MEVCLPLALGISVVLAHGGFPAIFKWRARCAALRGVCRTRATCRARPGAIGNPHTKPDSPPAHSGIAVHTCPSRVEIQMYLDVRILQQRCYEE